MTVKIEAAKKTVVDLKEKLAVSRSAALRFAEDSKALSFEAHTNGGAAKKKLDEFSAKKISTVS
jgi:hypothetical protein